MIQKLLPAIKDLAVKLLFSLKRFPEALFLTSAVVFIHIILHHHTDRSTDYETLRDILVRVSMVLALGVPLMLSLKLFFERIFSMRNLHKIALYLGIGIGLILYYFFLLKNLTMVPLTRYTAFTLAFYLVFILIPYFYKRQNFELYCVQLLTNFAITYFYAVVLYLGLAAILFTISKLFLIKIDRVYFDIWLIVAGIFSPAYFLADVPELKKEFQVVSFPKVLKILLFYIVVPLLIAYSAILYAYFAKIIITRTWPEGIVSHLVLWYSLISSIVIFFIYPFRPTVKWVDRFLSLYPKFMLPLLAMMFVSMGIRIHSYGITENRYFVLIAGIWVSGILIYYLFAKKIRNIILPTSLAMVAILSVTGPWSSYSISKFSQNKRFTTILAKYDMIQGNTIVKPTRQLPKTAKAEIISILGYFERFHSLKDLKYLPTGFKLNQTFKIFGFKISKNDLNLRNYKSFFNYQFPNNQLVKVEGYDYFLNIPHSDVIKTTGGENIIISYQTETDILTVTVKGEEIYHRKIDGLITPFIHENTETMPENLTCLDENNRLKIFYVFNNISGEKSPITDEAEFHYLDFFVFIKFK